MYTKYAHFSAPGKPPSYRGRAAAAWSALLLYAACCVGMTPAAVGAEDSPAPGPESGHAVATLAAGCFWCIEADLEKLPGVISVVSGYSGGHKVNPSYKDVSAGDSGHREVVRVLYDPERLSYAELLRVFWRNVDPTDGGGQFCDRGFQYSSAIFYHGEQQRQAARVSLHTLQNQHSKLGDLHTEILPAAVFYEAEERHQDYYKKNPLRYRYYRFSCGRDKRLERLWGAPPETSSEAS